MDLCMYVVATADGRVILTAIDDAAMRTRAGNDARILHRSEPVPMSAGGI
jgi:hypothetical protein